MSAGDRPVPPSRLVRVVIGPMTKILNPAARTSPAIPP